MLSPHFFTRACDWTTRLRGDCFHCWMARAIGALWLKNSVARSNRIPNTLTLREKQCLRDSPQIWRKSWSSWGNSDCYWREKLCHKSRKSDFSFTPGFSPVMNDNNNSRATVLTVCSSVKALRPLNTREFRQLPSKKPLKRFPNLLRRQTPG